MVGQIKKKNCGFPYLANLSIYSLTLPGSHGQDHPLPPLQHPDRRLQGRTRAKSDAGYRDYVGTGALLPPEDSGGHSEEADRQGLVHQRQTSPQARSRTHGSS